MESHTRPGYDGLSGPKILLIDDDTAYTCALGVVLEKHGFDVITSADGDEGLKKARSCKPDLIILDIVLPKKDGYSVCRELKEDSEIGRTPVLILSGIGSPDDHGRSTRDIARYHKADGFIDKPVTGDELVKAIDGLLTRRVPKVTRRPTKRRVLLVDDDRDFLSAAERILKQEDFEIWVAENGVEAVKMANAFRPDLILLDVMLPGKDGYTVCHELKGNPDTHTVHVILVSAIGEMLNLPSYAEHIAFEHGADDFMTKPIKAEELLAKVKGALRE